MQKATRASRVLTQIEIIVNLHRFCDVSLLKRHTSYIESEWLSLSDKVCTAKYMWWKYFESKLQKFGSSMCCTATGIFNGFLGELLTFLCYWIQINTVVKKVLMCTYTYFAVQAVSQPNMSISDNKQTIY